MKEKICIHWFKRDLRLTDNEALSIACSDPRPLLLLYILEPSLEQDAHYSDRHFTFIKESLSNLNQDLAEYQTRVVCAYGEVTDVFRSIQSSYDIESLYSLQETGIQLTYQRDLNLAEYCRNHDIRWKEFQQNGVIRGIQNRQNWKRAWYSYMKSPLAPNRLHDATFLMSADDRLPGMIEFSLQTQKHTRQKGGRTAALRYATSFFEERVTLYSRNISKPEASRTGCSRLSPYLAWGNLSVREVYQEALKQKDNGVAKGALKAFMSRLRWHCHFIQKFEMESRMEFEAVNKGYLDLEQVKNPAYLEAWMSGQTGYPLVDASMRCLALTGYVNFRMRAMVTSFLTHHLFQHFTWGSHWLARQFLDFEPGIHYGQMQMQAGFTGINTIRVYNPTLNAKKHDEDAVFIKKYILELSNLPAALAIEPWKISPIEANSFNFSPGKDYPKPIVDIAVTRKAALDKLYGHRKNKVVKEESSRILRKHTLR